MESPGIWGNTCDLKCPCLPQKKGETQLSLNAAGKGRNLPIFRSTKEPCVIGWKGKALPIGSRVGSRHRVSTELTGWVRDPVGHAHLLHLFQPIARAPFWRGAQLSTSPLTALTLSVGHHLEGAYNLGGFSSSYGYFSYGLKLQLFILLNKGFNISSYNFLWKMCL